ncbi:MAG: hypothetical protein ACOY90_14860 [Candidatus Zhuqueibacterota bacterium]
MKRIQVFKFFIQYILPVGAIVLSIVSLRYSCQSNEIAERSLKLNIKPIIRADLIVDNFKRDYLLRIVNEGKISVEDLQIKQLANLLNESQRDILIRIDSKRNWQQIDKLNPGDSIEFKIKYEEIKNTNILREQVSENDSVLPIHFYNITYHHPVDKTLYELNKYLFLYYNPIYGGFLAIDPDAFHFEDQIELRHYLDTLKNRKLH